MFISLEKNKKIELLYNQVEKNNFILKKKLDNYNDKYEALNIINIKLQQSQFYSEEKKKSKNFENSIISLNEKINNFQKQIQENFYHNTKENNDIYYEIKNLKKLNNKIIYETTNFTKILKGNNKIQGNWGEMILNKILESSGLREGHEYHTQVSIYHLEKKYQPDVIIKFPKGKDIIIDSKMTLVAYERYYNSNNLEDKKKELHNHIMAIKSHLNNLSNKNYHKLTGIKSLDYVLMFIPIEPAFLIAIDNNPQLISEAFKLNIMIVSPSTLLVVLRTINNIWKYEQQNKNSQIIADKASKMYEKIRIILNDVLSFGKDIEKIQKNYFSIIKKLSTGRGNLIKQVESFKKYGVEIKKPIDPKFIDTSLISEDL